MIRTVTFQWDDKFGDCEQCGLPAAFYYINAYGVGIHEALCSVCAANEAADGADIARIHQSEAER